MFNDDALNIHWSEISELGKLKAWTTIFNPHTGQSNPSQAECRDNSEDIKHRKKLHFLEQLENTM